jgi:hypothetical protein
LLGAIAVISLLGCSANQAANPTPHQRLAREILRELIEIDTTATSGDTARAVDATAARLYAGGLTLYGNLFSALTANVTASDLASGLRGNSTASPSSRARPPAHFSATEIVLAPEESGGPFAGR